MDVYKGQLERATLDVIKNEGLEIVIMPVGCTDKLRPMDQIVNSKVKDVVKKAYSKWYTDQVVAQLQSGNNPTEWKVDFRFCCGLCICSGRDRRVRQFLPRTWRSLSTCAAFQINCSNNCDLKKKQGKNTGLAVFWAKTCVSFGAVY